MVCRSQLGEVLLRFHVTHPYNRVTSAFSMRKWSERGNLLIVQLPLEPFVACAYESDPLFDLWQNVGACVDKTAYIQKLRCLSIPLTCCSDAE